MIEMVINGALDDLKYPDTENDSFDVYHLVSALHQAGRLTDDSIDVWNHMERSFGSVYAVIEGYVFMYVDFKDVDNLPQDPQGDVLRLVHHEVNKELTLMRAISEGTLS